MQKDKGRDGVWSVVIPAHQEVDALIPDQVDETMLLSDSAGPDISTEMPQRFRFSDALKGVSHHGFDELENPKRDLPVGTDPEAQVLPELVLENRERSVRSRFSLPFLGGQRRFGAR